MRQAFGWQALVLNGLLHLELQIIAQQVILRFQAYTLGYLSLVIGNVYITVGIQ